MTQKVRGNLLDENDTLYVCLNTISGKFNSINTSKSEKISRVIKLRFCESLFAILAIKKFVLRKK